MTNYYRVQQDSGSNAFIDILRSNDDFETLKRNYFLEIYREAGGLLNSLYKSKDESTQRLWEPAVLFSALFVSRGVAQTVDQLFKIG